jgi:hypothetical protein
LRESIRVAVERVRRGLSTKSKQMVGLRGVGKTVLLDRMREDAEAAGLYTVRVEAPEGRSLPALLAPQLRLALLRLSRNEKAKVLAVRALRGLAGFAKALKVRYQDIEVGIDFDPEPGLADNGDLEHDLQALLEAVGDAAKKAGTALVLFVDELRYVEENQLAALIGAAPQCAAPASCRPRGRRPAALAGPDRVQSCRAAVDFPSRCPDESRCNRDRKASTGPRRRGEQDALRGSGIHTATISSRRQTGVGGGGRRHHVARRRRASKAAVAALTSFFRVRFDRLMPLEKRYLRAMAELARGHRSGDIARPG